MLPLKFFLSFIATDGKDRHGLKCQKIGSTISTLNLCLQNHQDIYYVMVSALNLFHIGSYPCHNSTTGAFF